MLRPSPARGTFPYPHRTLEVMERLEATYIRRPSAKGHFCSHCNCKVTANNIAACVRATCEMKGGAA